MNLHRWLSAHPVAAFVARMVLIALIGGALVFGLALGVLLI
jgi:hypothetical protein